MTGHIHLEILKHQRVSKISFATLTRLNLHALMPLPPPLASKRRLSARRRRAVITLASCWHLVYLMRKI